jgi:hypothetical protein
MRKRTFTSGSNARAALLGGAFVTVVTCARAQTQAPAPSPVDESRIGFDSLFRQGREEAAAGAYEKACDTFERAANVRRTIGIRLNLADCYEHLGRTATAWGAFNDAMHEAQAAGDSREMFAHDRAAALALRLTRLTIDASSLRATPSAQVLLDGALVERSKWLTGIPADPGTHSVRVVVDNVERWSQEVDLTAKGGDAIVVVPERVALTPPAAAAAPATTPPLAPIHSVEARASSGMGTQRAVALVAGAAALGAITVGVGSGVVSLVKHNEAAQNCDPGGNPCQPAGIAFGKEAVDFGNVSTVAFLAGGVLFGVAAVLSLTAPRQVAHRGFALKPEVGAKGGDLLLEGRW